MGLLIHNWEYGMTSNDENGGNIAPVAKFVSARGSRHAPPGNFEI